VTDAVRPNEHGGGEVVGGVILKERTWASL
jgi:hypothetical protein